MFVIKSMIGILLFISGAIGLVYTSAPSIYYKSLVTIAVELGSSRMVLSNANKYYDVVGNEDAYADLMIDVIENFMANDQQRIACTLVHRGLEKVWPYKCNKHEELIAIYIKADPKHAVEFLHRNPEEKQKEFLECVQRSVAHKKLLDAKDKFQWC